MLKRAPTRIELKPEDRAELDEMRKNAPRKASHARSGPGARPSAEASADARNDRIGIARSPRTNQPFAGMRG